ncbi:polyphosphate kinase 2 family protein, partial [Streptomyces sp. NPDC002082]
MRLLGAMGGLGAALGPSGCRIKAFKAPTPEEQNHPFLWRIMKALP